MPPQEPSRQNLPLWFIAVSLAGVIYAVVALAVLALYSQGIGLLMLLPIGGLLVVAATRTRWRQIAAVHAARKRTSLGRALRVAEAVVLIYILFEAGRSLYKRL